MASTKTTLYLPTALHRRLKATAGRTGKTISELVAEGARIVLDRLQGAADREALERRAIEAEKALEAGLVGGGDPTLSRRIDEVVYGLARKPRKRR